LIYLVIDLLVIDLLVSLRLQVAGRWPAAAGGPMEPIPAAGV
jgi:hypothetical protein